MSRYTVGQDVFIVNFTTPEIKDATFVRPWADEIVSVNFAIIKCESEHEVPINYVESEKGTGFIFKDERGCEYHNQYPTASYGQLSDSGDRLFIRVVKDEQDNVVIVTKYTDFFAYMANIQDAVYDFRQRYDNLAKEHQQADTVEMERVLTFVNSLLEHYLRLSREFEAKFDKKLICRKLTLRDKTFENLHEVYAEDKTKGE